MYNAAKSALALCITLTFSISATAQERHPAKNFIGTYGGIDWSNSAAFTGITAERTVFARKKMEAGITAGLNFPYRYGNLALFASYYSPVITQVRLGARGYSFTAKDQVNTGFFIAAGAGMEQTRWKENEQNIQEMSPYGELGFGWKWPAGKRMVLRWTNTLTFATRHPFGGGDFVTVSCLSLGF